MHASSHKRAHIYIKTILILKYKFIYVHLKEIIHSLVLYIKRTFQINALIFNKITLKNLVDKM